MGLVAQGISKSFGAVRAVRNVSVEFKPGRVRALVGENGAGKSTLVKCLAGFHQWDTGQATLDAQDYRPHSLREAVAQGVAMVFQELTIHPMLTIAENIFVDRLRQFRGPGGLLDRRRLRDEAQRVLSQLEADIDIDADVTTLTLAQTKIVELARAVSTNAKVIFLDEVTAYLDSREIPILLQTVEQLKEQGIAIGYISHHLQEVLQLADDITVMRDGEVVAERKRGETSQDELERLMVGRETADQQRSQVRTAGARRVILQVRDLAVGSKVSGVSFELNEGEILGIAGLAGSGGEEVLRALIGDLPISAGSVTLGGKPFVPVHPHAAIRHGISYVPGDRASEGVLLGADITQNMTLSRIPRRGIWIDRRAERDAVAEYMATLNVKAESSKTLCGNLSGGNQQKVVIGKCLNARPRILLLNNPTRGIDVGARREIQHFIGRLVEQGMAVVLVSEDLPELLQMSDRILVMRQGRISKSFSANERPTEEQIIQFML